jgi:hypothetical protein
LPILDDQVVTNFVPRSPDWDVEAQIIAVLDGVSQIGENQIVVLNIGAREGIEQGHVLAVWQRGETIVDPVLAPTGTDRWWKPPMDESQRPHGIGGFPQALDDTVVATGDGAGGFVGQFLPSEDDPWIPGRGFKHKVTMPDQRAGVVMVFRPFERVSYALVMQATRAMHVLDMVKNP